MLTFLSKSQTHQQHRIAHHSVFKPDLPGDYRCPSGKESCEILPPPLPISFRSVTESFITPFPSASASPFITKSDAIFVLVCIAIIGYSVTTVN